MLLACPQENNNEIDTLFSKFPLELHMKKITNIIDEIGSNCCILFLIF